jgi:hypothetical protein
MSNGDIDYAAKDKAILDFIKGIGVVDSAALGFLASPSSNRFAAHEIGAAAALFLASLFLSMVAAGISIMWFCGQPAGDRPMRGSTKVNCFAAVLSFCGIAIFLGFAVVGAMAAGW